MLREKFNLRYSERACDIPQNGHGIPKTFRIIQEEISELNSFGKKYRIRSKGWNIVIRNEKATKPNNIPLILHASPDEIFWTFTKLNTHESFYKDIEFIFPYTLYRVLTLKWYTEEQINPML